MYASESFHEVPLFGAKKKSIFTYGSGHEGVAVLLPGFAIIW